MTRLERILGDDAGKRWSHRSGHIGQQRPQRQVSAELRAKVVQVNRLRDEAGMSIEQAMHVVGWPMSLSTLSHYTRRARWEGW